MKSTTIKIIKKSKIVKEHVESRLLRRLLMFSLIAFILFSIVIYNIMLHRLTLILALAALLPGLFIGFIAGRMFKISWKEETQEVVSRLDRIGSIFLVFYISVEIGRKWLFGHWLSGAQLNSFGLAFLTGLLLGRFLATLKSITRILHAENKFS
ncbi:MAG: hypothetical protein OEV78_01285 [Spirochaetia bacterium]|nr:hypothetical protein [Spirochaetia bacterium]